MTTISRKWLLKAGFLTLLLAGAIPARAVIVGPYTVDTNTLHLWHMDASAVPVPDAGTNLAFNYGPGANPLVNLNGLVGGATLSNAGFPGFGTCLNTLGPLGLNAWQNLTANTNAAGLFPTTTTTAATTMAYEGTNGAFTIEALICPLFPVTTNFGPASGGGIGASRLNWQIVSGESGTASNRIWQFRFDPIGGISGNKQPQVDFIAFTVSGVTSIMLSSPIPTNGPNAIVSNQWYHIAVTYSGVPNTAGNFNFYWTLMDSNNTSANLILSTNLSASIYTPYAKPSLAIGNTGRSDNGNWLGLIDEVRMSSVARNSAQMMFAPAGLSIFTQPASQFVAVGDNVNMNVVANSGRGALTYQWALNSANINGATNSIYTIPSITTNQAGSYTVLVSDGVTSSNSSPALIQVGGLFNGLFNTGIGSDGTLLGGGAQDPHWQLETSPDPAFPGPAVYAVSAPIVQWLPEGPNSDWLSPGDGNNAAAGGLYTYSTTFYLDTVTPTNAIITGSWMSDNNGQDIRLNGVSLGISNSGSLLSFTPFTITNGFVAGSNLLECVVSNTAGGGNNPTGIRVQIRGIGQFLPPQAPALLALPSDVSTNTQQSATFVVSAVGSAPLTYQWYFGATPLASQTGPSLTLTDLTTNQSGTYTVIVSNNVGTTNASVNLTVLQPTSVAWLGLNSGDWDLITTNWLDTVGLTDVLYNNSEDVLFDDRGSGAAAVNLTQSLQPNSVTVNSSANYIFGGGGALSGNMKLTQGGSGTLIVDTVNNYSGVTLITNGTLQVGNNDASGSLGSSVVTNKAVLVFDRTDTYPLLNRIDGTGGIVMEGTGNLQMSASNSFSGGLVVSNGTVTTRNTFALGAPGSVTTVESGATLLIDQNLSLGNQPLTLNGFGSSTFGALQKSASGLSIFGGTISLASASGIYLNPGASLTLTNPVAVESTDQNLSLTGGASSVGTINGTISLGAGSISLFSGGAWILTATNNSWTGGTTLESGGGTLQLGDGGPDGSIGSGAIDDETTLMFDSSTNVTYGNTITGGGAVWQIGTGTLLLTGNNSYGGGTQIRALGSILMNNSSELGSGTITVGTTQLDTSSLKLSGGIQVNNQLAIFPRAFGVTNNGVLNPADFINVDSTNILASPGAINIPSGGNLLTFECDGGFLSVSNEITAIGVGRDLVFQGPGPGEVRGNIDRTGGNSTLVWKLGTGTWTFWGNNSPSAATTVSNGVLIINGSMDANSPVVVSGGTLGGTGSFGAAITVSNGMFAPTLAAGLPIATVTATSSLILTTGSTTALQIDKGNGTNDQITGLTNLVVAGALTVTNLSGTLAAGDTFQIFNSSNYSGSFASITPPTPGAGLRWNLASPGIDGTLRVISTNISRPTISTVSNLGASMSFSGSGGTAGGSYYVLTSTNVLAHLSTWTRVSGGVFDNGGNFTASVPIGSTPGANFFALQAQ